jgi:hypothetical protein
VTKQQDGIHSRWHQQAAVDGDLPPARPARNAGTPNPVPNSTNKNTNQDENWKQRFFLGDEPPTALTPVARPAVGRRETAPRVDRPKWLAQVFQPEATLDAPTTTKYPVIVVPSKKERAGMLSSRQRQQRKDMPDCQPSRPVRQRSGDKLHAALSSQSGGKCPAILSSDASNTHATEDITDHDDNDNPVDFDDDISDMTPEDYSETSVISDSQSYIRPTNNSKSLPQDVSTSKTKNMAPVSSIGDPAASTPEPEPVDAAQEATAAKFRKMLQM